jgi:hypothetical protein
VIAGERELYQRFADYDDEELLRILTDERAQYRSEALAAAEMVLMQRGVALPLVPFGATEPPAPHAKGQARPKSPYQLIDAAFDVLLVCVVCWAIVKLWAWTMASPEWGWSQLVFWLLAPQILSSAVALRRKWRAKEWRD